MLVVNELEVGYGPVRVLHRVSLEVNEGELVTLIGANGAGKTTLLKTISGLLKPSSGNITFLGQRIDGLAPEAVVRLGIAHCPEGRRVFPGLTVTENLAMGAYTRKDRKGVGEDLERIFQFFPRLKERSRQIASTLSGGEQQMLAIGRALMSRPRLMLFDEPSMGLAPNLTQQVSDIIKNLSSQGITILLVEQNAPLALGMASRGYVLEAGTIVIQGRGESLRNDKHVKEAYLGN